MKQSYFEPASFQNNSSSSTSGVGVTSRRGSRLTVSDTERADSGFYVCTTQNAYGSDSLTVELVVLEQPDAPVNVELVEITSRTMTLVWNIEFDGNSPLLTTVVEVRPNSHAAGLLSVCSVTLHHTRLTIAVKE